MKNKKIFAVTLALMLALIMSLTSCSSALSDILNPSYPPSGDADNNDSPSNGKPGNVSGGDDSAPGPAPIPSEDGGSTEFYPGSGGEAGIDSPVKAVLSAVSIVTTFESSYGRASGSVGSGVIYKLDKEKGDAYIITNFHVVYNRYATTADHISDDISLYLYGMELEPYKIKAAYIGGSLTQDLALLKVEGSEVIKNSYARAADIGSSDNISVMDGVIVVGNPEGYGLSVTTGIVSVDSETLEMTGADNQTALSLRVIRIDAAVNEGNSGGGLFDDSGNLIGIVNAKRTGSDTDNIAYAIPISYAAGFAENIRYYCDGEENRTVKKCLLGVTVTNAVAGVIPDKDSGTLIKADIVEVSELAETSLLLGQLEVGDRLTAITVDGSRKEISRVHHLIDHVLLAREGSRITIDGTRSGVPFTVTIEVPASAIVDVK